jgi:rubrerythrin
MDKSLGAIITKAIKKEEEAYEFYMDLYNLVEDKTAKDTLKFVAQEEKKHKEFLVKYREGGLVGSVSKVTETQNYKIAEHMDKPDIKKDMKTQDVYLVAAARELNAHNYYKSLADIHPAGEAKDLLTKMANEEMKHKEKMEYLYTNTAFPQTAGG